MYDICIYVYVYPMYMYIVQCMWTCIDVIYLIRLELISGIDIYL